MLIGNFNLTTNSKNLEIFINSFNLKYLIKKPTCFQSENPSCIDLILTNTKVLFKHLEAIQVGISDGHNFVIKSVKSQVVKGNGKTKIVNLT